MNVLVPVLICDASYQVVRGRPYSFFERTLLEAIAEGHATLEQLTKCTCVNRNIIIQGIVTLVQAGWVDLSAGTATYVLTKQGEGAMACEDGLPPTTTLEPERKARFVCERLWRNICPGNSITYVGRSILDDLESKSQPYVELKHVTSEPPDPAEVRPLLEVNSASERILGVGPVIRTSVGQSWVHVGYDRETGRIIGLPQRWTKDPRLLADIRDAANAEIDRIETLDGDNGYQALADEWLDHVSAQAAEEDKDYSLGPHVPIGIDEVGVLVGAEAHMDLLCGLLDKASPGADCIVIHTETLAELSFDRIQKHLFRCLAMGANVDIMWGRIDKSPKSRESHATAVKKLREIETASFSEVPGRLMVSNNGTGLRCNLVISNAHNEFEAIIGSHRWFGNATARTVSLRTANPSLVRLISGACLDWMSKDNELRRSYNRRQLETISGQIIKSVTDDKSGVAGVVQDGRHMNCLFSWLNNEDATTFIVATPPDGQNMLLISQLKDAQDAHEADIRVVSGVSNMDLPGEFRFDWVSDLFANAVVVGENRILVGSFDWLGKNIEARRDRPKDFGIWIELPGIGNKLCNEIGLHD